MRQTPNGQNVATFGIATNREWVTKDGRKENSAEFHDLVAWAKLADICAQYLKKGKLIYVEGYLKTRSWDSPEGVKKFRTEIVVQDMIMLDKRNEGPDFLPEGNEMEIDENITNENHEEETNAPAAKVVEEEKAEVEKPAAIEEPDAAEEPTATDAPTENKLDIDSDLGL